jgi:hypothetical protein
MVPPLQMEANLQNSERYFASLMNQLVDMEQIGPDGNEAFNARVNELFYVIESVRFLFDRGIMTDNATCQAVYNKMMCQTGVYASNLTKDDSLIIPEL